MKASEEGRPTSTDSPGAKLASIDATASGFFADPYPQYAFLRTESPIHQHPSGVWMVFRYDDVLRVFRDPELSSREIYAQDLERTQTLIAALGEDYVFRPTLTRSDPPEHTRLRRLLSVPFTPRRVEAWRERIADLVDEFLDRAEAAGSHIDAVAELGMPLSYRITCEMLGMPPGGHEALVARAAHLSISATMEPFGLTEDHIRAAQRANVELYAKYADAIAWKRGHLSDDLLSILIGAEDRGELSARDVLEQVGLLFAAGHTTTSSAVALSLLALMRQRDQWELLCRQPTLAERAVEECLRYDNTIQGNRRTTRSDYRLGDITLPAGSLIFAWQGSANRDESKWGPTADRLDLTRAGTNENLSFGSGPHLCLGAWLARAEMAAVLQAIAVRFPSVELAESEIGWQPLLTMRGPTSLHLDLKAA
jgi:cytochrome P450